MLNFSVLLSFFQQIQFVWLFVVKLSHATVSVNSEKNSFSFASKNNKSFERLRTLKRECEVFRNRTEELFTPVFVSAVLAHTFCLTNDPNKLMDSYTPI